MPVADSPLAKLMDHAGALYSLPTVAMEVVRLTSREDVETRAIKDAIEGDPALTAKILRVVNSSMFGLSGEVGNLTQAIALLGVRPLKLLVLGFSLPDRVFADLAGDHLRRFWTISLTRAMAARSIATDWFTAPEHGPVNADDAFVAGLLRDLGLLVLIQEIGEPYLKFLETITAADGPASAGRTSQDQLLLERQSLGFDHVELTASLMRKWKLPADLAEAVDGQPAPSGKPSALPKIVRLAELVTQLVVDHRLAALPELLVVGDEACSVTQPMVHDLVAALEFTAPTLAEALRAPFDERIDFQQTLAEAHKQMTQLAEATAAGQGLSDDEFGESLLAESHELRLAMRAFLRGASPADVAKRFRTEAGHPPGAKASRLGLDGAAARRLEQTVGHFAQRCRDERRELSLAMIALEGLKIDSGDSAAARRLNDALEQAEQPLDEGAVTRLPLADNLLALLTPGGDRRAAIALVHRLSAALQPGAEDDSPKATLHAGVASIVAVPNRFEPIRLIEGAARCLQAAQTASAGTVKSIEVY